MSVVMIYDAYYEKGVKDGYNQALEDFANKMNKMSEATDLRDNGYYIENLVSIAKNELTIKN